MLSAVKAWHPHRVIRLPRRYGWSQMIKMPSNLRLFVRGHGNCPRQFISDEDILSPYNRTKCTLHACIGQPRQFQWRIFGANQKMS